MNKIRDIILLTKVHIIKAMVFPVVMYGCESWTRKKAECWRIDAFVFFCFCFCFFFVVLFWIDAFELWCWRRLLRVSWTARSNHSILKEIQPEYSLKGLMLKLKLQCFGHLMWRTNSLEKILILGNIEGRKRRGITGWDGWLASTTQWTWIWANSGRWGRTRKPCVLPSMGWQRVRYDWVTEQQQISKKFLFDVLKRNINHMVILKPILLLGVKNFPTKYIELNIYIYIYIYYTCMLLLLSHFSHIYIYIFFIFSSWTA